MEKSLVLITSHYPFSGEPFLDDEMDVISSYFKQVFALPESFHNKKAYLRKDPNVVKIVVRKSRIEIGGILWAAFKMFSPVTNKERRFAYNVLGYRNQKRDVNRAIFLDFYISFLLGKAVKKIDVNEHTIFYSYWMSSGAYFLSQYKKVHPEVFCVCRTHGGDCYIDKFYNPFRREILLGLDMVLPISDAGKESIEKFLLPHVGDYHAQINVERLGVKIPKKNANTVRRDDCFHIITCSNVIPLKRLDLMVDSLSLINGTKIYWMHFGDGELLDEMKQRAEEKLAKKNNIIYQFKGKVSKNNIMQYYSEHYIDLFINASDTEGIPVSIMEAMSYGIPAIARDVGGNSELVDNSCGILLGKVISPSILAQAIECFISLDQEELTLIRENARNRISKQFNAEINYKRFCDYLRK